jgi:hypothetical protein
MQVDGFEDLLEQLQTGDEGVWKPKLPKIAWAKAPSRPFQRSAMNRAWMAGT